MFDMIPLAGNFCRNALACVPAFYLVKSRLVRKYK